MSERPLPVVTDATTNVKERIESIEASYEFFLAYAAQGLTTDQGAKAGVELRTFLDRFAGAIDGLADAVAAAAGDREPADAWADMVDVVRADSNAASAAVRLVSSREGVSSQLIDSLNANVHIRALLTDLFLVDELLDDAGG
ncbi:MAG: hypothetical protein AAF389_04425 [Gemmatimonadota bacterium]